MTSNDPSNALRFVLEGLVNDPADASQMPCDPRCGAMTFIFFVWMIVCNLSSLPAFLFLKS